MAVRTPGIARACFHLNWLFAALWSVYLLGPDVAAVLPLRRSGPVYAWMAGALFLLHFVVISTGIIALFVVIIEIHARRPVRGLRHVLLALALPIASFLYFAARFLLQVKHNLG